MTLLTDHIIEDSISFVLLIALIGFLWFRPWHARRMNQTGEKDRYKREQKKAPALRNKAA